MTSMPGLQNQCGGAIHRSVGSTPAPLRRTLWPQISHIGAASLATTWAGSFGRDPRTPAPRAPRTIAQRSRKRCFSRSPELCVPRWRYAEPRARPRARRPCTSRRCSGTARHARRCEVRGGAARSCSPSYQAQVWSPRDRRPIWKSFANDDRGRGLARRRPDRVRSVRRDLGQSSSASADGPRLLEP
jgi:hypothetical protein